MNAYFKKSFIFFTLMMPFYCLAENPFTITGEGKMRIRYIDATIDTIKGSYGEGLVQGLSMKQRLDLVLNVPVTSYLNINGTLRITNEDSQSTILPPPELVSTKVLAGWWSLNFDKSPFGAVVGSYDASFTPLTFMRWDSNDNPLGASGCACQVSVGGISGESLEEPQEDYKIEGVKLESSGEFGEVTALFARPQVADEGNNYARYMYGGRTHFVLPFMGKSFNVGASALRAQDDTCSVSTASRYPLQSDVIGFDYSIPLFWDFLFIGEFARSTRDDNLDDKLSIVYSENGIIGGLQLLSGDIIESNLLYMKMDPNFTPLYRALSYAKNREGFRFSFTYRKLPLLSRFLTLSCYIKQLKEIKPTWDYAWTPVSVQDEKITTVHKSLNDFFIGNFSVNLTTFNNWKLEGNYEYRNSNRPNDISTSADETINNQTKIVAGILTYEFTMQSKVMLKYQFIDYVDKAESDNTYKAYIPSLQFTLRF